MKETSELVKYGVSTTFDTVFFLIMIVVLVLGGGAMLKFVFWLFNIDGGPETTKWLLLASFIVGGVLGFLKNPPTVQKNK